MRRGEPGDVGESPTLATKVYWKLMTYSIQVLSGQVTFKNLHRTLAAYGTFRFSPPNKVGEVTGKFNFHSNTKHNPKESLHISEAFIRDVEDPTIRADIARQIKLTAKAEIRQRVALFFQDQQLI